MVRDLARRAGMKHITEVGLMIRPVSERICYGASASVFLLMLLWYVVESPGDCICGH